MTNCIIEEKMIIGSKACWEDSMKERRSQESKKNEKWKTKENDNLDNLHFL